MVETRSKKRRLGLDDSHVWPDVEHKMRVAKKRKLASNKAASHNQKVLATTGNHLLSLLLREDSLYPIYRNLIEELEITDIIMLTRTCKSLSGLHKRLLQTEWDINRYLSRWWDDPKEVRCWIGEAGAVIGGTAIYDFMNRRERDDSIVEIFMDSMCQSRLTNRPYRRWHSNDWGLNLTAEYSMHWETGFLIEALIELEGYRPIDPSDDRLCNETERIQRSGRWMRPFPTPTSISCRQLCLVKRRKDREERIRVSWRCLQGDGLPTLLDTMKSTASMHFLFWDRCVCVFPNATFKSKFAYVSTPDKIMTVPAGDRRQNPHLKRGWHMEDWKNRGIKILHEYCMIGPAKRSGELWSRSRRIIGPEAWQIQLDDLDDFSRMNAFMMKPVLESAFMEMSLRCVDGPPFPIGDAITRRLHLHAAAMPLQAPTFQYPIFIPAKYYDSMYPRTLESCLPENWDVKVMTEPLDTVVAEMWQWTFTAYAKDDCIRRYLALPTEQRPRRRSERVNPLDSNDPQCRDRILAIVLGSSQRFWRPAKDTGWWNDVALKVIWEEFLTHFGKVEALLRLECPERL